MAKVALISGRKEFFKWKGNDWDFGALRRDHILWVGEQAPWLGSDNFLSEMIENLDYGIVFKYVEFIEIVGMTFTANRIHLIILRIS